jgi:hypothetical protein
VGALLSWSFHKQDPHRILFFPVLVQSVLFFMTQWSEHVISFWSNKVQLNWIKLKCMCICETTYKIDEKYTERRMHCVNKKWLNNEDNWQLTFICKCTILNKQIKRKEKDLSEAITLHKISNTIVSSFKFGHLFAAWASLLLLNLPLLPCFIEHTFI